MEDLVGFNIDQKVYSSALSNAHNNPEGVEDIVPRGRSAGLATSELSSSYGLEINTSSGHVSQSIPDESMTEAEGIPRLATPIAGRVSEDIVQQAGVVEIESDKSKGFDVADLSQSEDTMSHFSENDDCNFTTISEESFTADVNLGYVCFWTAMYKVIQEDKDSLFQFLADATMENGPARVLANDLLQTTKAQLSREGKEESVDYESPPLAFVLISFVQKMRQLVLMLNTWHQNGPRNQKQHCINWKMMLSLIGIQMMSLNLIPIYVL